MARVILDGMRRPRARRRMRGSTGTTPDPTVVAAPVLRDGASLVVVVNLRAGRTADYQVERIRAARREAAVIVAVPGIGIAEQLNAAIDNLDGYPASHRRSTVVRAIGVAGGDGTAAAGAAVAMRRGLPLVVIPTGTLNHFARDAGVGTLEQVVRATRTGSAIAVTMGEVEIIRDTSTPGDVMTRPFLNTANLGGYPDFVRLRERWRNSQGRSRASVAALVSVLRHTQPFAVRMNGEEHTVWAMFVGNGPYRPAGMFPAGRPRLDSTSLDVRWLSAMPGVLRPRAVRRLAMDLLRRRAVFVERQMSSLHVELSTPGALACDGELAAHARRLTFRPAAGGLVLYSSADVAEGELIGRGKEHEVYRERSGDWVTKIPHRYNAILLYFLGASNESSTRSRQHTS